MDDLYFIPKCIKTRFERQPDGTPIRMLGYSFLATPGASPYPSLVYEGTDYFKALKKISKHEAEMIQRFLMGYDSLASFEIATQPWPKAPKIDAVYFLTNRIQFENNGKVFKRIDTPVQEGNGMFKSYLYSILQLIVYKPYTIVQDAIHGQFFMFQFIRKIIFSNEATIIIWDDGSKTVSKCLPSDTFDSEIGVLLCILKKFYKSSHLNKMFKRAMALMDKDAAKTHECLEQIKKANQPPICPYCKTHTMMLHHTFYARTIPNEVYYECGICHSRSPVKQTAREAKEAAMTIE